jgi:hypothetical protein
MASVSQRAKSFQAFNAKYSAPEEVAETFIPPPQWDSMIMNGHTLLVGPRGAGKTSILKMLTSPGIMAWRHDRAQDDRDAIGYVGVFITTDRTWTEQVTALGDGLRDVDQTAFGIATFSAQVLHGIVSAAAARVHDGDPLHPAKMINAETEANIASECALEWGLTRRPVVTLRGLQHALTDRVAKIADLAEKESLRSEEGRDDRLAQELPSMNFDRAAMQLIDRFNTAAGEQHRLWCLLFDELELAPPTIVTHLTRGLRGGDPRLLFKLSLAPYTESAKPLHDALSAQQAHDFNAESLTYAHKHVPIPFCRALLAQRLGIDENEVLAQEQQVLGRSQLATDPEDRGGAGTAYTPDSVRVRRLRELASKDRTFAKWLSDRDVDLDHLDDLDPVRRAATVRKVPTLALLRLNYRTDDDSFERIGRRRRTRKTYEMFGGLPALFEMVEGNPRWFMNLVAPLADKGEEGKRPPVQNQQIREVVRLFRAILTAIPVSQSEQRRRRHGVLPILDAIGSRLSAYVIDEDFNPDPPGKFRIDDGVPDDVVEDLQFALNAGGIIHMPDDQDEPVLDDLRGHTFRLAYMLAPWYPLPLTTGGRTLDLSTILEGQSVSWEVSRQLDLEHDLAANEEVDADADGIELADGEVDGEDA